MAVSFRKLHPHFVAEVSAIDLRQVSDRQTLETLRGGMDQYGVLVFRNQPFTRNSWPSRSASMARYKR